MGRGSWPICFPRPIQARRSSSFSTADFWRALTKDHVSFVAGPLVQAGAAVALPGYDLCPSVSLQTVVTEAKQALLWTRQQAARLNGDPDRIYVAGNSAGAHLAAMMLAEDWTKHGLARSPIAGAILVTGIYDLRPILRIQVNEDVRLLGARRSGPEPAIPVAALPRADHRRGRRRGTSAVDRAVTPVRGQALRRRRRCPVDGSSEPAPFLDHPVPLAIRTRP